MEIGEVVPVKTEVELKAEELGLTGAEAIAKLHKDENGKWMVGVLTEDEYKGIYEGNDNSDMYKKG